MSSKITKDITEKEDKNGVAKGTEFRFTNSNGEKVSIIAKSSQEALEKFNKEYKK